MALKREKKRRERRNEKREKIREGKRREERKRMRCGRLQCLGSRIIAPNLCIACPKEKGTQREPHRESKRQGGQ